MKLQLFIGIILACLSSSIFRGPPSYTETNKTI